MPLYEYLCDDCGGFSAWGSMSEPHAPRDCPACGRSGTRQISAPNLALVSASVHKARERNERSAHEPMHRHRSGCGCTGAQSCGTATTTASKPKLQRQTRANARPWMLGH